MSCKNIIFLTLVVLSMNVQNAKSQVYFSGNGTSPTGQVNQLPPIGYGGTSVLRPYWQTPSNNPYAPQGIQNQGGQNSTGEQTPQKPDQSAAPLRSDASKDDTKAIQPPLSKPVSPQAVGLVSGDKLSGNPVALDGRTLSFAEGKVFLDGIDVPPPGAVCRIKNSSWRCGDKATETLSKIVEMGSVHCLVTGQGELAGAICKQGRDDIGSLMVRSGMAVSESSSMRSSLEEARADHRGLWSGGDFAWRNSSSHQ